MNTIKTIKLNINGMTCEGCARGIENKINCLNGIIHNKVSYEKGEGEFSYDESITSKNDLINEIEKSGHYQVVNGSNSNDNHFDLIIIGGGSAAFSAAIKANELEKRTLIINAGLPMGGTCVNVGCVPSKYLIRAAESIHNSSHSNFKSVKTNKASFNFKDIIQEKGDLVNTLRQQKYIDIASDLSFVTLLDGYAKFKNSNTVIVDGNESFTADKFLIATGSKTKIPPINGLENIDYLTNRTLFELEELPDSLVVLGGGYIALEIAQMMHRLGSKVTLIQRSAQVLSNQVEDIAAEIQDHLRNEGIKIITDAKIELIENDGKNISIDLFEGRKPKVIRAEKLVVATGTSPNTSGFGLEEIGVELNKTGHINTNQYLQTNIPTVFAAGDNIETPAFVYTAAYEGNLAVENMFREQLIEKDYLGMPWVVFTDPQIAGVGKDEAQAEKENLNFEVSKLPLELVPRSIAALDTRGFVKLIRDKDTDKLIGARIVAPEGSELTMELSLAIKYGIPTKELAKSFHAYLTLSEAVKLAAIGFGKDVHKLSCCAS
jgi:mercuric reductase